VTLCQAPFFATLNNRIPAVSTLISFVAHAAILIPLSRSMDIYAFPIASGVFPLFTSTYLLTKMRRTFGRFAIGDFKQFFERTAVAILFMAFALEAAKRLVAPYVGDGLYAQAIAFLAPSILGSIVLFGTLAATGVVTPKHLRQMRPALKTSVT
jgi:hypothetical protein